MAAKRNQEPPSHFQGCHGVIIPSHFQAILASAFAKKDYDKASATASRVHTWSRVAVWGKAIYKDVDVLHLISIGIPFVAATQPINALAFVFDGVNFGASDFAYSTLVSSDSPMLKRTAVLDAEDSPMQLC
ncbi:unnamed protein product [Prunus armeniaca]|uniref:Uncharacterized protein n=1 Tax=Prunus armeniaca TaxID=36596 RepID=A0A6J5X9Y7_PRUAR|nr:unnamed protein product [Prunus armeniaca]